MTFAEKMTSLRIANSMSQEQLAKVLGVTRQSVSRWEQGEAYPTVDKLLELTKLFRVTADVLINDSLLVNVHKNDIPSAGNKYFGTDGFRGESNKDLTAIHAFRVGRFLGWYYSSAQFAAKHPNGEKAKICIGKDTRRSSYMLEYALCAGITASGTDAYILHVTTTPSVSYITRTEGFDCGVMITASHNVFYDNGIKVLNSKGEKLDDSVSHLIECYIDGNLKELGFEEDEKDLPYAIRENIGSVVDHVAGRNRYIGYLIGCSASSFRDMKIALDCANGSAWMIARNVFAALGADVKTIGCEPTGLNTNKDCGSTHIEALQKYVRENHMDVGFAFDGDADRCMAVDEHGDVVDGDKILYILAKRIFRHNYLRNNTVVSTIMSNSGLTKALKDIGINNVQTKVGDRFVYECMMQNNYWLGGEQSGHVILRKYANTGDGILTAIKLTEEMITRKSTLSRLAEPVHLYPQVLKNVRVVDKRVVTENPVIKERVAEINKELDGNGRILLRESGTEPVIRIMVECDKIDLCNKYIESVFNLVKKGGYLCE